MSGTSEAFGELRSAFNRDWTSPELFTSLMRLCQRRHVEAPDEVTQVWVPYAQSYLERWPSEHRRLSQREVSFDPFAPAPWMSLARRLSLRGARVDDSRVDAIGLRTTHRELTHLDLHGNALGELGARRLARLLSRHERLTSLDVSTNPIGWKGAAALVSTLALAPVRELALAEVSYGSDGFSRFLEAPLSELESFSLANVRLDVDHSECFVAALAGGRLERLSLRDTGLSDRHVDAMAARAWPALRALDLSQAFFALDSSRAAALSRMHLPALESFAMAGVWIDHDEAAALASASWWDGVRDLDLSSGGRRLDVLFDGLVRGGRLGALRRVDLSLGKVPRRVLEVLAEGAPSLEECSLSGCELDDWGIVGLCEGEAVWTSLDLSYNSSLGARAFGAIAQVSHERPLRALGLRACHVGPAAARALAGLNVERLDLSGCHLQTEGLRLLCEVGALDHARELILRDNRLDASAVEALRDHEAKTSWRQLDLSDNPLQRQGRAVASSMSAFALT